MGFDRQCGLSGSGLPVNPRCGPAGSDDFMLAECSHSMGASLVESCRFEVNQLPAKNPTILSQYREMSL